MSIRIVYDTAINRYKVQQKFLFFWGTIALEDAMMNLSKAEFDTFDEAYESAINFSTKRRNKRWARKGKKIIVYEEKYV